MNNEVERLRLEFRGCDCTLILGDVLKTVTATYTRFFCYERLARVLTNEVPFANQSDVLVDVFTERRDANVIVGKPVVATLLTENDLPLSGVLVHGGQA